MTTNRREEHFAAKHAQLLLDAPPPPCTLPQQAYGPQRIEWVKGSLPPVWVWVSWPDRAAERIAAYARGWNDRVVIVAWYGRRGQVDCVVWRNAVAHRRSESPPA